MVDNNLFSRYSIEKFGVKQTNSDIIIPESRVPEVIEPRLIDGILDKLSSLSEDHPARVVRRSYEILPEIFRIEYIISMM
jgi:hypothetical protein